MKMRTRAARGVRLHSAALVGQDGILRAGWQPAPGGQLQTLAGGLPTRRRLPTCPTSPPLAQSRNMRSTRGSGLLAVLWLSAALAAIAFSLSVTVRGEIERTSTEVDGLRCGYLASAGIERAAMELLWSAMSPDSKLIPKGSTFVNYVFPSGNVRVDIIPETSKLDVNKTSVEDLGKLLMALGLDMGRAGQIAEAIASWRQPGSNRFDGYYSGLSSSFQPSHASFREIEELLLVRGITPDIFYGTYVPAAGGTGLAAIGEAGSRLARRSGLMDCLSVYGTKRAGDVNTGDRSEE